MLASQGIACRIDRAEEGWRLLVAGRDVSAAGRALETWERENPDRLPTSPAYGPTWGGLVVAGILVAFWLVCGSPDRAPLWFRRGAASAERILSGEIWRTVTALTLHVDVAHLAANSVGCALFVTAVCRALGPGLGGMLVLLAGACGNVVNALVSGPPHSSVGASTAVFGAVGVLAGLQAIRRRASGLGARRAWAPVAAGLALLAMLGTGERADLPAHLFGFLVGGLLGVLVAPLRRPPPALAQGLLALAGLGTVGAAWWIALG